MKKKWLQTGYNLGGGGGSVFPVRSNQYRLPRLKKIRQWRKWRN